MQPLVWAELGKSSYVSLRWLSNEFIVFGSVLALYAFEMWCTFPTTSYLTAFVPVSGCCLWSTGLPSSGDAVVCIRAQCLASQ